MVRWYSPAATRSACGRSRQPADPARDLAIDRAAEADFHEIGALPDGRGLIFTVHRRNKPTDMIAVFAGGSRRVLLEIPGEDLRNPIYSPTGHLLYERETTNPGIWAVPFSLDRLETTGAPMLVIPGGSSPSLARDGTLCFVRVDEAPIDVVRVSRTGVIERVVELAETNTSMVAAVQSGGGYRPMAGLSLSPDGTRLAVSVGAPGTAVGLRPRTGLGLARGHGQLSAAPAVWSTRGDRLIYASARDARAWNLWSRRADGAGDEQRLSTSDEVQIPMALSPDGSTLVFSEGSGPTGKLFQMPADGQRLQRPLFSSRTWGINASFSPDGRWLAYESVEVGPHGSVHAAISEGRSADPGVTSGGEKPTGRRATRSSNRERRHLSRCRRHRARRLADRVEAGRALSDGGRDTPRARLRCLRRMDRAF